MSKKIAYPPRKKDPFYGDRYSVPVVCWDEDGEINPNLVCWDYKGKGWVFASLSEGPNADDYDIDCTVWDSIPDMPVTE